MAASQQPWTLYVTPISVDRGITYMATQAASQR